MTTRAAISLDKQAQMHKALGHPARLRLLALMDGTRNCDELGEALTAEGYYYSQPTVAHHVRILQQAGLIDYIRHGLHHYYNTSQAALEALREALERSAAR